MFFSYQPRGNFSVLNEKLTAVLGIDSTKNQARVYPNCVHALLECAIGFFQTFSSKKRFYYFKNIDPHFELAITALSKAGLEGKALSLEQFHRDFAWTEILDRESGFVFLPDDHPMTGEIYDNSALIAKLTEKAVFRIRLSHNKHLFESLASATPGLVAERSEIRVMQMPPSLLDGCAIAVMGERGRFGAVTAEALSPTTVDTIDELSAMMTDKIVFAVPADYEAQKARVVEFETLEIDGLHFFFESTGHVNGNRIYDRTVFYFEDMDGSAFLHQLALELGDDIQPYDPRFDTASLIRWGGLRTMQWLEAQGLSANAIRGLCVIDSKLLAGGASGDFAKKFITAREKVLALQS